MEFQRVIFRELYEEDRLAVVAKGLGSVNILVKLLKLHCNIHGVQSQQAVFVLNCSEEESLIRESLLAEGVNPNNLPKVNRNVLFACVVVGCVNCSCLLRLRSEEHTSELQSLMRISYAVFCLKKKIKN